MSVIVVEGALTLPAAGAVATDPASVLGPPGRSPLKPVTPKKLPSDPPPPTVTTPTGDYAQLPPIEGQTPSPPNPVPQGAGFDPARSTPINALTTPTSQTFANPDGTRTTEFSTRPKFFKDATGTWRAIDLALTPNAAGDLVPRASGPGVTIPHDPTKGAVEYDLPNGPLTFSTPDIAGPVRAPIVQGPNAVLAPLSGRGPSTTVQPTTDGFEQSVTLPSTSGPSSYRMSVTLPVGVTVRNGPGLVEFIDATGKVVSVFGGGLAHDAGPDGAGAFTPARAAVVAQIGQVASIQVSIDPKWLADPSRVAPVWIDPGYLQYTGGWEGFVSNEFPNDTFFADTIMRVGQFNNTPPADVDHTLLKWDLSSIPSSSDIQVFDATLKVWDQTAMSCANPYPVFVQPLTSGWSYLTTWANQPTTGGPVVTSQPFAKNPTNCPQWDPLDHPDEGGPPAFVNLDVKALADYWLRQGQQNFGLRIAAAENIHDPNVISGKSLYGWYTGTGYRPTLSITYTHKPGQATPVYPANPDTISDLTPTLQIGVAPDADRAGGEHVYYDYRVATGSNAESGTIVADSGWTTSTSYKIPDGALSDGITYSWHVHAANTSDNAPPSDSNQLAQTTANWVAHFTENQRLGTSGPSPFDSIGPFKVNLGTGNVALETSSPKFTTAGGDLALDYTYNSMDQPDQGLLGTYKTAASQVNFERRDRTMRFAWGTDGPGGSVDPNHWGAEWNGYLTVPDVNGNGTAASWKFYDAANTGVQVWLTVNGTQTLLLNDAGHGCFCPPFTDGTAVSLVPGTPYRIKVGYQDLGGSAGLDLRLRPSSLPQSTTQYGPIPAAWLSVQPPALPGGWKFSADLDGNVLYHELKVQEKQAVLTAKDGRTDTFSWTGSAWKPPAGVDGNLTQTCSSTCVYDYRDPGGLRYHFLADGTLAWAKSATDDRKPAAPEYGYSTLNGVSRLTTITDPVSDRSITLDYSGTSTCPTDGYDVPPPGMLCQVHYWDGTVTKLYYASGQLSRILDPGTEVTDFGYTGGRVSTFRDALGYDTVASGARADDPTTYTHLTYDAKGRVTAVQLPVPSTGQAQPRHTYSYTSGTETRVNVDGLAPATGYARRVTFDDAFRTLTDTDATGKMTTTKWDSAADAPHIVVDTSTSLETSTFYDYAHRPYATYGPAPTSSFDVNGVPTATVPMSGVHYDEGINTLAAAYWNNNTPDTIVHDTGVGWPGGNIQQDWGTSSPVTGIGPASAANPWTLDLTGAVSIATAGSYTFQIYAKGAVRLAIDDVYVVDDWVATTAGWRTGTTSLTTGEHRIRIEYEAAGVGQSLVLDYTPPGDTQHVVPGTALRPRYNLVTSRTDADGKKTSTQYDDGNVGPEHGLPTAEITDPGGLNLTTTTTYETLGSGYLRRTSRSLPAGNGWTYQYYADHGAPPATGCANASSNQAGLLHTRTGPSPDGSAAAQVDEYVYDAAGQVVASRSGTTASPGAWTCTTYDARGRILTKSVPAWNGEPARTVTYNYAAVYGSPLLTSVADPSGTIYTLTDLLGRQTAYIDAPGQVSNTTYDQPGRVTDMTGANGTIHTTYDAAGRPTQVSLDGQVVAIPGYDGGGRLSTVSYPSGTGNGGNGTNLAPITYDTYGRETGLTWQAPGGATITSDSVTRSLAGRVTDESIDGTDPLPSGDNFTYDAAGRLTVASVPGHIYGYGFDASGGCGTDAAAGKNSNRTSFVDLFVSSATYCYDNADRLTGTTAAGYSSVGYDDRGNTITLGGQTLGYDGADRHVLDVANSTVVRYTRDASDRIIGRNVATFRASSHASNGTGSTSLSLTKPPGVQNGDVLLSEVVVAGGSGTPVTPPSGWTVVSDVVNGSSVRTALSWHVVSGGDPASWTWTLGSSQPAAGGISAYSGVDTASPIMASSQAGSNATTSHSAPSVTPGGNGALLVNVYGVSVGTSFTAPSGTSERFDQASSGSSPVTAELVDSAVGTMSATGSRVATSAVSGSSENQSVLLRPAVNGTQRYAYTAPGDTPDATLDAANNVIERTIPLPGGVVLTKRTSGDVWSYPNVHGDVVATANAAGVKQGATLGYDPYGNPLAGNPDNSDGNLDYGWLGKNQRPVEHEVGLVDLVEMGARPYDPTLGRFLASDPVEGGSANDYDYVNADPVNGLDLNGLCGFWCHVTRGAKHTARAWGRRAKRVVRGARRFACSASPICTGAHYGTVTFQVCWGGCLALSWSNRRGGVFGLEAGAFGTPGGSLMWSPSVGRSGRASVSGAAGGCFWACLTGSRRASGFSGTSGPSYGAGTPGGFLGIMMGMFW